MEIRRDSYLEQLISYRFDGLVKVITGIRRCGKSYLLKNIYRDYLMQNNPDGKRITFYDALNDLRNLSNLDVYVTESNSNIQSAYAMPTVEKAEMEIRPFTLTGDFFPKIVVRKDIGKRWYDDNGILNINVIDFLLDKTLI